jgi:hypothetical protein
MLVGREFIPLSEAKDLSLNGSIHRDRLKTRLRKVIRYILIYLLILCGVTYS